MLTYIVRPYFGHDCNSWNGFNNGHYLDEMEVKADSESAAIEIAMERFKTENPKTAVRDDDSLDHLGDYTIAWITVYSDDEGNEISRAEFDTLNESDEAGGYLYQYIDFSHVELKGDNK